METNCTSPETTRNGVNARNVRDKRLCTSITYALAAKTGMQDNKMNSFISEVAR